MSTTEPHRPPKPGNLEPRKSKSHSPAPRVAVWTAVFGAGIFAALIVVVGVTVAVLLHSARFHNYLLDTVEARATRALGVRVELQDFALHLSTLSLDLYGLTVDGADPYPNPPLLQADHVAVGVRVVSILHRKWYLDTFRVDHPVVKIFTDRRGGSNLPTLPSSSGGGNTSLFDFGIRHAVLDRGEVDYNNRQSAFSADLRDVDFAASFNALLDQYSGRLAYSDGRLAAASFRPVLHSLDAQFDATPSTFYLTRAKLTSGASQFLLTATLEDYSHPNLRARYDAMLDGGQLRQILESPSLPAGMIHAAGTLAWQETAGRAFLDAVVLNGDLSSGRLEVHAPSLRAQIRNLAAHYSLQNGDATLHDLRAGLLGGEITATGKMSHVGGDSRSQLSASLRGLSLKEIDRATGAQAMPQNVGLAGVLNAQANAAWGKTFDDLVAHADATIHGAVSQSASSSASRPASGAGNPGAAAAEIPVDSTIHGTYTGANGSLALENSDLRTPQSTLTMNGVVSKRSSLALKFQSKDLSELETVADLFRTPTPGHPVQPLGLAGTASFEGNVQGSVAAPRLTGYLTASNLKFNGTDWRALRTNVEASPSFAALRQAELEPASHGRITFNAGAGLTKWSFTKTSPVELELNASQLSISELTRLTGSQIPVTGTLAAKIKVSGTELSPRGQGSVSLTQVKAYDEPVRSVKLTFSGTGDEVQSNLAVELPAGSVDAKLSLSPRQKSYVAELTSAGIHLDQLEALKSRNMDAKGVLRIDASGRGSFDNPQLDATLQIPQLEIQNQSITGLNLKLNLANHLANANLAGSAMNTGIRANARINLTGDYPAQAALDTQAIPLEPLLAAYLPSQAGGLTGETEVHATLNGPLKNWKLLEAHVTIPTLKLAYTNAIQLGAASPIQVDYKNGVFALQRVAMRGTGTDLEIQGSIPVARNAPMSLLLLGNVDLGLAQAFSPDIRSSGQLKFNINSAGAANLGGRVDIVDANFANSDLPVGLQHGNGVLTLAGDRLNISKFEGTVGGGTLTAQGGIAYRPNLQFDFGVAAKGVRALYPQGVRETVNANLRLAGTPTAAVLGGQVNLSDLSFTPAFDLNNFINQFSGGVEAPPEPGLTQNIQLNVAVRSSSQLNLVSRALSVNGSANLQLRGTASDPVMLGRVNLSGGDLIFNGDRFLIDGGTIEFVNPAETEPVVNLALSTTIQQYNISMRFNGPINQLRTNYSSDPSLPAADIINLLAFGQTTEASSANPSTPANQAAESLVASQVSSQITSRISKVAGISQLSINPVLAGGSSQGPPGANITIQQRVTGNLFITFSSNLASTQNQTIQGQYQISPRVAFSATRDQNGGFGFDALIKKTW